MSTIDTRTNRIDTSITICAPPDQVWSVLTDFAAYPSWSPVIRQVRGAPRIGGTLSVRILGPHGRTLPARPVVRACEPSRVLCWDAVLVHRRFLSGLHEFRLEEAGDGTTLLRHSDTYTGLLAAPLRTPLAANEPLMVRQNEALRDRVAAVASGSAR